MEKMPLELSGERIRMNYLAPLNTPEMSTYVHQEENRHRVEGSFQRDFARIMYSSSFRRLQGKMQLFEVKNDQFFRNRLTHSLEVAQIARSIAHAIQYDSAELFVVEAGALAHDIGNPPFGHAGETYLNNYFANIGGYEGNAQTLRILMDIEKKRPAFRGLNLTYRTLFSVVKYYNCFNPIDFLNTGKQQKFIYDSNFALLDQFVNQHQLIPRTLDVQIVDIADEISYAAHDLEDGLRIKAFTIDEILHEYQQHFGSTASFQTFVRLVEESKEKAGYGSRKLDSAEYSKLFRQEISSALIHLFLTDIDMLEVNDWLRTKTKTRQTEELQFTQYKELVSGLKTIVYSCINHNDSVYSYEQNGLKVLQTLCERYLEDPRYLPPEYRAATIINQYQDQSDPKQLQMRLVCDYISGMMDSYAISNYEKITGAKFRRGY